MSTIKNWINLNAGKLLTSDLSNELHKPIIKNFKRRKVVVYGVDDIWASDLVDMSKYSKQNKHFKFLLVTIDIFSKFLWIKLLKNKTGLEVTNAFKEIIKERQPNKLWVDLGKEFYNSTFKNCLKEHNIELYSTNNEQKSCIVERVNRTIKEKIAKYFTAYNTTKYYDVLDQIVNEYNNTFHNTIKMTPVEGSKKENEKEIYERVFQEEICEKNKRPKFKVNDRVRITKYKNKFKKGYEQNWTSEIFVIDKVLQTNPYTFRIKDLFNASILGSFYENELQKTKF